MIKIFITFLSYILIFFNTNLLSDEVKDKLKIGLLAPFSGDYKYLGNSLLLSTQLALNEIGDDNILIIPRNSGSKNKAQLNKAIETVFLMSDPDKQVISSKLVKEIAKFKGKISNFVTKSTIKELKDKYD